MAESGGGGGGGLSGGSSGAAYSGGGGGGGYSGDSYSSSAISEAERKRLEEELLRQQEAAAAAAAAATGVPSTSGVPPPAPVIPTTTTSPTGITSPIAITGGSGVTRPAAITGGTGITRQTGPTLQPTGTTTNLIATPYGKVEGTIPALSTPAPSTTPAAPNPLTKEGALQQNLNTTAQNYRDLVAKNAPVDQRNAAKEQYSKALEAKATAARTAGGAPTNKLSRPMYETGAISAAQAFGKPAFGGGEWPGKPDTFAQVRGDRMAALAAQGLGPDATPQQQADAVTQFRANWNTLTPEQQGQQYYKAWQQTPQNVPSLRQEASIRSEIADATQQDRTLSAAIRDAKAGGVDEKGKRTKPDWDKVASLQEQQRKLRIDKGLIDPANPTVGLNMTHAMEVARDKLLSGGASLTELARQQRVGEEKAKTAKAQTEGKKTEPEQTQSNADAERQRILEDEQRKQAFAEMRRRYTYM